MVMALVCFGFTSPEKVIVRFLRGADGLTMGV
jgi:hypothetical protein